jgi:hypothetical protein
MELPHDHSSHGAGSSDGIFYKVEVRTSHESMPVIIPNTKFVIDAFWREWPVTIGAQAWGINIPIQSWCIEPAKHGLLTHIVAEAHRWALLASLEAASIGGTLCIETRLVAVRYSTSYSAKEVGVTSPLTGTFKVPHTSERQVAPKVDGAARA